MGDGDGSRVAVDAEDLRPGTRRKGHRVPTVADGAIDHASGAFGSPEHLVEEHGFMVCGQINHPTAETKG